MDPQLWSWITPALIWLILGIVFILMEFAIPGFVIAFFGAGALLTSLMTYLGVTSSIAWQLALFIVFSLMSLFLLRKFVTRAFCGKVDDHEIEEFNMDVGKIVTVTETIDPHHGSGKITYHGTIWKATARIRIESGESARVIGKVNITIEVEPVEDTEDTAHTEEKGE
ncbi:MAG: NfeD family protein [Candidatus Cloacimonetes bacterium]|nr:NfeD family protein [Candidatus Cloacimonadota bacterium]